MKIEKKTGAPKPHGFLFVALLAIILAVLFGKSFLPGYVHFSNDGPLGQQNAAWRQLPAAFTGTWYDINDLGSNAGAMALSPGALIFWVLGAVGYAKFLAAIALFILGLGAWAFFRQLKLSPLAAILGGLAATLNSAFFATACWGVASQQIAVGMDFFALALVVSSTSETPVLVRWARLALAGLAVGINVMEAADIGAIFSLFVAAFVFYKAIVNEGGALWAKVGRGVSRVAVIALFAGFIAVQTIVGLVGAAIVGIAGTAQTVETKEAQWDWATEWSLPKIETPTLFVPGLFGYKMDTPNHMMESFVGIPIKSRYQGGEYWGAVGRDPALVRYFDSGKHDAPAMGFMRFTGGQNYAGILVVLAALWAMAQSLRRQNSVFPEPQRRLVWFWSVVLIGSLLLAFGHYAPFYKFFYMLPYASTIRNPTKFLLVFSWAIVILFAYGIHGLSRRYLEIPTSGSPSLPAQLRNWWAKARGFDRNWTYACGAALVAAVLGWLVYASEKPGLVRYLQTVGFGDEDMARQIATFSIGQVGWFVGLLALAVGLYGLIIAGVFAGRRARLGGIFLGLLLVGDLGRADLPYIIHWDYYQKYDIDTTQRANSTNPIINFLRDKPYEHRVAILPYNTSQHMPFYDDYFCGNAGVYRIEWAQHHFPYYDIQSLDKIQMPRTPGDLMAYESVLAPRSAETSYLLGRHWELTNTRYVLGPAGFLEVLNDQLDPVQRRFRIARRFDIVPKPGIEQVTQFEEMTAMPSDTGALAVFDFTGALPRAGLYSNWQISTNDHATLQRWLDELKHALPDEPYGAVASLNPADQATLKTLTDANFDPAKTVLLSTPLPDSPAAATHENSGTVTYTGYAPTRIALTTQDTGPAVLMLNDMYDPNWQVFVDGQPAKLLRCNFIMRGVFLPPGGHTVEFIFSLPHKPLYITSVALGVGILLCGFLVFATRRNDGTAV